MNLLGRVIRNSILFLILFFSLPSEASPRDFADRLSGIEFVTYELSRSTVYNAQILFKFNSQDGAHSLQYIEQVICDVSRIVFEYLESNGIPYRDGKPGIILDFYEVRLDVINDISRFDKDRYYPMADRVYGIWDPIANVPGRTAIVVSTHKFDLSNRELISHELGHFWYYRLGLSRSIKQTHEEFAETIEDLYVNKIRE